MNWFFRLTKLACLVSLVAVVGCSTDDGSGAADQTVDLGSVNDGTVSVDPTDDVPIEGDVAGGGDSDAAVNDVRDGQPDDRHDTEVGGEENDSGSVADSVDGGDTLAPGSLGASCAGSEECDSANCSNDHCAPAGFAYVPAGTFCMGTLDGTGECPSVGGQVGDFGETRHQVTLSRPFFLQETETTQEQWLEQFPDNPSEFDECGLDCPVEFLTWWEAVAYLNALSQDEGLEPCYAIDDCDAVAPGVGLECDEITVSDPNAEGNPYLCEGYRLPMEAEWEYAYRATTDTAFYNGPMTEYRTDPLDENLDVIAWYGGNSGVDYEPGTWCEYELAETCGTHPVGGKQPNEWGLYDMSGNVWEWVWDRWGPYPGTVTDPLGGTGGHRRFRGGPWASDAWECRGANFDGGNPDSQEEGSRDGLGFRPARSAP